VSRDGDTPDAQRARSTSRLPPGSVVAGRFAIERVAGSGGMGTVFRAFDQERGVPVALKVLWSPAPEVPTWIEHEAQILASMSHPAAPTYVDHGAGDDGLRYLAMDWFEGEVLDARLARGPMRIDEGLAIAGQVAEVLTDLHGRGVVHRDLKPPNLLLEQGEAARLKILDFGIASFAGVADDALHEGPIGTPFYMAPEQARGDADVDARADLYALGCILFECLTGRTPFIAASPLAVLAKTLFEEPVLPSEMRPGLPAGVDALVDRLLKKDRAARPSDALSVAEEIRALRATKAPPPVTAPLAAALTRSERRLVSVVLASDALRIELGRSAPDVDLAALTTTDLMDGDPTIPSLPAIEQPLQRLRDVGREHGAQVELLRDGSIAAVLAGTGSPMDLASDAARCALALRALLPEARFSLVTGWEVFTGMQPVGRVIDRAAALLDITSPSGAGSVLLDPMTAALLGPRFVIEGAGRALSLEGEREAAEEAWTVLGRPTTCVGRAEELRRLEELFEGCVRGPAARAVVVRAAPGTGKSRLLDELLGRIRAAREGVTVWSARGDSMRRRASFGLLGQLVRRTSALHEDEPLDLRRQKLAARVARFVSEPLQRRVSEFLGELVGTPFPAEESVQLRAARQEPMLMGDQIRRAWIDFLEAECRAHPVVVVLDDLQWGDPPTVDFLDSALRLLSDRPLFVLALARPEVSEALPDLWRDRGVVDLELGPLSAEAGLELAQQVLGPEAAGRVIARIFERSSGNAFFLEELLRAEAEGRGGELPDTVLAMMQSRLATLEPEARRVLRAGSLFGEVFWRGAAASLLGLSPRAPSLIERLAELERCEWISRQPDPQLGDEDEYIFRHALVREAAYEMLTREDRELGHRLAGEWLERAGERDALTLATHFERGGDPERAARWYRTAAMQALEGNDLAGALARVERGIACGASGALFGELCLIRAEAHRWQGSFAEGAEWALRAQGALPKGSAEWFSATREALQSTMDPSERDRFAAIAGTLDELWTGPDTATGAQVTAMAWVATRLCETGLHERGEIIHAKLNEAVSRFQAEPSVLAQIASSRAFREFFGRGDVSAVIEHLRATVDAFERAGDLRNACFARANAGHMDAELGAYQEAVEMLRVIAADAKQLGLANVEAIAKGNLGRMQMGLGLLNEALESETEAVGAFAAQGDARMEAASHAYRAAILRRLGDLDGAEADARRAVSMLAARPTLQPMALATLADVLLARGRAKDALDAARVALAAVDSAEEGEAMIRLAHAEAAHASGAIDEARASIRAARDRLLERAAKLANAVTRASFLGNVEENARTLALARAWLPEEPRS
jgi:tetratricopeptide (TPR) repeat protein